MDIKSYSRFLKADEDVKLGQVVKYTITDVTFEMLGQGEEADKKYVLHFEETERGLALNSTNLKRCLELFGNKSEAWVGKAVTIKAEKVQFGAKQVPGFRIQ